eukprot:CAMPEP_0117425768 /NCGR_PEP_ID=MMETSP0758-20121206/6002_1 /TAXON_ID=63605 /ORGANISM="Percolomonas cosmopolitus, Strain AE-1 (ATCC 50343)" /LENGTH=960 /DNA_ID=CAMNT_0005210507 /DNA_START=186 /DNA_END=3065 /DNA_ORIENTATION=+
MEIAHSGWPELDNFLNQCINAQNVAHEKLGYEVWSSLLETSPGYHAERFREITQIVNKGINHQNEDVRSSALKMTSTLTIAMDTDEDFSMFIDIACGSLFNIMNMLIQHQRDGHDDMKNCFDSLTHVTTSETEAAFRIVPDVINFGIEIAANKNLLVSTRDKAVDMIVHTMKSNIDVVVKNRLYEPVINMLLDMITEYHELDDEDDQMTPFLIASVTVEHCSILLPSKYIFDHIVKRAMDYVNNKNPVIQRAGLALFGNLCDGCRERMKTMMGDVLKIAEDLAKSDNYSVSLAAVTCMINMVEYLIPDIRQYAADIFETMLTIMNQAQSIALKRGSVYIVELICVYLETFHVEKYIEPLFRNIMKLSQTENTYLTKHCLAAIASLAKAGQKLFLPFHRDALNLMTHWMNQEDPKYCQLRSAASDAVGIIGSAIGPQHFGVFVPDFMNAALRSFSLPEGDHDLRENSFNLFANIADTMGHHFKPFVGNVLNCIYNTLAEDDAIFTANDRMLAQFNEMDQQLEEQERQNRQQQQPHPQQGNREHVFTEAEATAIHMNYDVDFNNALIDEKAAATLAIGALAKALGPEFNKLFVEHINLFQNQVTHIHCHIRQNTLVALLAVLNSQLAEIPVKGPIQNPLVKENLPRIFHIFISMMDDEHVDVVEQCCQCLRTLCMNLGPEHFSPIMQPILEKMVLVLTQKANCNKDNFSNLEESDHDSYVVDSVCDTIDEFARVYGQHFVPHFEFIFPVLFGFLNHQSVGDRQMIVGSFGEIVKGMNHSDFFSNTNYFDQLIPHLFSSLNSSNNSLLRNTFFCIGIMIIAAPNKFSNCMNDLEPLMIKQFEKQSLLEATRDNLVTCICNISVSFPQFLKPRIMNLLLQNLPLKEDYGEYETLSKFISHLLFNNHESLSSPQVSGKFLYSLVDALHNDATKEHIKQKVYETIQRFKNHPSFESARQGVPPHLT